MRVAVLGVGGVGGYYGGVLARAGHDVYALARGPQLAALREHGLRVATPEGEWTAAVTAGDEASALSREFGADDLVLVTTKAYSLDSIAPAVRTFAERGSSVVPLLNGVDIAERLVFRGVAAERLLGGLTYLSAARAGPGAVERRSPFQRVLVGELAGGLSPRAERIAGAFRDAGVEAIATPDIVLALWQKFVFLVTLAAACGLTRSAVGELRDTPLGRRLIERALREAIVVGRARGLALPPDEETRVLGLIDSLPAAMRPSLLLDLEAGGPTEVDVLSGAIARFAEEAGIDTPVHDTAAAAFAPARPPAARAESS